MATKFYLRNLTPANAPTANTELSTANPNAASTFGLTAITEKALSGEKGTTATTTAVNTQNSAVHQDGIVARFSSGPLKAGTYGSGTWTFAIQSWEGNTAANMFHQTSNVYFWRPSNSSVVGRVVDAHAQVGVELGNGSSSRYGQTLSLTGADITIQDNDILVIEVWLDGTQSMNTAYAVTIGYEGTTDVTSTYSGTDPASYLQSPVNIPELVTGSATAATATATAYNASVLIVGLAGLSETTGTAYDAKSDLKPNASLSTGTATAFNASIDIKETAGIATADAAAFDAGFSTSVNPPVIATIATAYDAAILIDQPAGLATATAAAFDATLTQNSTPAVATSTATAYDATAQAVADTPSIFEIADAASTVSGATLQFTVVGQLDVDDTGLVLIGADNAGAAGISSVAGVTDSQGNTWTEILAKTIKPTNAANDGATLSIWKAPITTTLGAADTITVSFSPDTASKVAKLYKLRNVSGYYYASATASGEGDA